MFPSRFGLTLLTSLVVGPTHTHISKNPAIHQVLGSCPFIGKQGVQSRPVLLLQLRRTESRSHGAFSESVPTERRSVIAGRLGLSRQPAWRLGYVHLQRCLPVPTTDAL
jgi:hypothetical protein